MGNTVNENQVIPLGISLPASAGGHWGHCPNQAPENLEGLGEGEHCSRKAGRSRVEVLGTAHGP